MRSNLIFSGCLALGLLVSSVAKSQTAAAKKDIETGKGLIAKSDCFACHKPDAKLVGPSYGEIAKKYADNEKNLTLLAGKIIKGGSGNWGAIPMSPHPQVTQVDAKKMAKYILSLPKAK